MIGAKLVLATITDKVRLILALITVLLLRSLEQCMACPWGGLDFSPGLFTNFAPLAVGVLTGEWWFND